MSNKKDIFDLFRESEPKLHRKPSPQAWDRLESRLNRRRGIGGSTLYRRMAMAAALLILVAFVAILPMYLGPAEGNMTASADEAATLYLEELTPSAEYAAYRPIAINETYANVQLEEGNQAKRLTVAVRTSGRINQPPAIRSEEAIALLDVEAGEMVPSPAPSEAPGAITGEETIALNDVVVPTQEIAEEPEVPASYKIVEDQPMAPPATYDEEITAEGYGPPQTEATARKEMAEPEPVTEMDAATNAITFESETLDPMVDQFQWLIGQWRTNEGLGESIEIWEMVNSFTISGKGKLTLNGNEIFTEEMQITKIENELYFITAIEESGEQRYFRLRSYENGVAVFEDEEESEQQLIIQQLNQNAYMSSFTDEETEELTPQQQNYLQYRNVVTPEQAVRNMSRIGNK